MQWVPAFTSGLVLHQFFFTTVFPVLSNTYQAHFELYAYNWGIRFQDTVFLSYYIRKEK